MARKTNEPKKLKIERDGDKFKCTWKNGEEYDQGVQFYYSWAVSTNANPTMAAGGKLWKYGNIHKSSIVNLSKNATAKTIKGIDFDDYYPKTKKYLRGVLFNVRGDRKKYTKKNKTIDPGWSEWEYSDVFDIDKPNVPKVGTPAIYDEHACSFPYSLPKEGQHTPYVDLEWQACLTKKGESPDWDHPDKTGKRTKSASTAINIQEDKYKGVDINWNEPNYSYTRHVRIRARGPSGYSSWSKPKTHVYTMSKPATNVSATLTKNTGQAGYLCQVKWKSDANKVYPNDGNRLYYTFITPDEHGYCPNNDSWTEVVAMRDTKDWDMYSFYLENKPVEDEAMYVKIDTIHDDHTTPGYPIYVKGSAQPLNYPTFQSISPNVDTHTVEISGIENLSAVPDSYVGVYYRDGSETGDGKLVGVTDGTSITTVVPEWGASGFAIGLQAIAGAVAEPSSQSTVYATMSIGETLPNGTVDKEYTITGVPISGTTISVYYTVADVDLGMRGSFTDLFTYGIPKIHNFDYLTADYDGDKTFVCGNTSGAEIYIDSIGYSREVTIDDRIPLIYNLKRDSQWNKAFEKEMKSKISWNEGDIPLPPTNVTASQDGSNSIFVNWNWNWKDANIAEISWATHEDAWESTDEPQTYSVSNVHASRWKISNLEAGEWYVRMRLLKSTDTVTVYGTYANAAPFPIKVSSAPTTPTLTLLPDTITLEDSTTATWAYEAADGSKQAEAELFEVTDDGNGGYSYTSLNPPAKATSAQFITIYPEAQGWQEGETHDLAVRVMSSVNEYSEGYSESKSVAIVKKPTADITSISLVSRSIETDSTDEESEVRNDILASLPLKVTVVGAGDGGTTYVSILRDGPYHGERPDGSDRDGFDNEVIASASHTGEGEFVFDTEDREGYFDDGGSYKIIATVKDSYGQTATVDPEPTFLVKWDHQAVKPDADIDVDLDKDVVFITPKLPEDLPNGWSFDDGYRLTEDTEVESGTSYYIKNIDDTYTIVDDPTGDPSAQGWYVKVGPGDTCDIYRLSADGPELLINGGKFGTKYVDPYPTYGRFGGHRVVYITNDGDYTAGSEEAITDFGEDEDDFIDKFQTVIDFADDQIILPYDITVSHKWSKDVTITKYLDGSIQADWNPAVEHSTSVNTTVIIEENPENIEALRRLATYPGHCHIRTPEGSSFTADIQVNEDHEEKWVNRLAKFSLSITRVDNPSPDGIEYDDWYVEPEEEPEE